MTQQKKNDESKNNKYTHVETENLVE